MSASGWDDPPDSSEPTGNSEVERAEAFQEALEKQFEDLPPVINIYWLATYIFEHGEALHALLHTYFVPEPSTDGEDMPSAQE